eukprot:scaffold163799_cov18-Tisochrysis_lutea.AAC.1
MITGALKYILLWRLQFGLRPLRCVGQVLLALVLTCSPLSQSHTLLLNSAIINSKCDVPKSPFLPKHPSVRGSLWPWKACQRMQMV